MSLHVTWWASSPSASWSIASTSARVVPGTVRMSTSMSTASGMMFVFCPPWTTFGENVVCVAAWQVRASGGGSVSIVAQIRAGSSSPALTSSGSGIVATCARHIVGELRLRPVVRPAGGPPRRP